MLKALKKYINRWDMKSNQSERNVFSVVISIWRNKMQPGAVHEVFETEDCTGQM